MTRCCCGACSITTGAQILASVTIILVVIAEARSAANYTTTASIVLNLVVSAIHIAVSALVLIAVNKNKAALMIPAIVVNFFGLIGLVIAFLASPFLLFNSSDSSIIPFAVAMLIVYGFAFALQVCFFTIYKNCYKYLKEFESPSTCDNKV